MPECGDFHNEIKELAVETGKQTVKIDRIIVAVEGTDGRGGLGAHVEAIDGRVESLEERARRHDELAALDRAKRERRFQFYGKVFWLFVAPILTAGGAGVVAIATKILLK